MFYFNSPNNSHLCCFLGVYVVVQMRVAIGNFRILNLVKIKTCSLFQNYSSIITEPEADNCFSINTQIIIPKTKRKSILKYEEKNYFIKSAATTGSHFVRPGDYRLVVRR